MNIQDDQSFQGSYNIIAKNICLGCQMEEQVKKLENYQNSILDVFVTFSSTKTTKKIIQTKFFKENKSQNYYSYLQDKNLFIQHLEQYQDDLIYQFLLQKQPLEEIILILNPAE